MVAQAVGMVMPTIRDTGISVGNASYPVQFDSVDIDARIKAETELCNRYSAVSTAAENKKAWDMSLAGVIGDEFVTNNGAHHWLTKLNEATLTGNPSTGTNCEHENGACIELHDCSKSSRGR
jgi:hypothetical protein